MVEQERPTPADLIADLTYLADWARAFPGQDTPIIYEGTCDCPIARLFAHYNYTAGVYGTGDIEVRSQPGLLFNPTMARLVKAIDHLANTRSDRLRKERAHASGSSIVEWTSSDRYITPAELLSLIAEAA